MNAEQLIAAIKAEQAATALEGLLKPQGRESFHYGHHCGFIQGLEQALVILTKQLDAAAGKVAPRKGPAVAVNPYLQELDDAPSLPEQYRHR